MEEYLDTIIIGGGQAGLAVGYHLAQRGCEFVILEQAEQPANAWRNDRWDSFTLLTPNWSIRMPGAEYQGSDPDGFLSKNEIIAYFEQYIADFHLPVRFGMRVTSVEKHPLVDYRVTVGETSLQARNVVVATGLFQQPKMPAFAAGISPKVTQLHSGDYRNPSELPQGGVLVVGSGQSGCQIAEELYQSGRWVCLCTGSAGRIPRRYRGKDTFEWLNISGFFDRTVDQLPTPRAKFSGNPHLSGRDRGRTLNLHQFARDGVVLLGHLEGAQGTSIRLAPDLKDNLTKADRFEAEIVRFINEYITRAELDVPYESLPVLRDGYQVQEVAQLDLHSAGVNTIIWAMGYTFDFSFVKFSIFDSDGYPIQQRGVTRLPGLCFVGLPWLYKQKSGLLLGVGEDAEYICEYIFTR